MAFPTNEAETIALFRLAQARLGWHLAHLQTAFPDAIIENERGQQLIVEFEFESKNFQAHKHDPSGCDLIIAYKDSWENPPVPVWALEDCAQKEMSVLQEILTGFVPKENLFSLRREFRKASREKGKLLAELHRAYNEMSFLKKQTLYGMAWQILCILSVALFVYYIWKY